MLTIPTAEPKEFNAGDTVKWLKALDYKPGDGWTLKYALRGAGSIDITATTSGDKHLVTIAASATADYIAGQYQWTASVEKGAEKYTIDTGYIEIKPNAATATTLNDDYITLKADIEAVNAFIRKDYKYASYSINGRSLSSRSVSELFLLRDRLLRDKLTKETEMRLNKGLKTSNKIKTRFVS
jgi:hypothetical protein